MSRRCLLCQTSPPSRTGQERPRKPRGNLLPLPDSVTPDEGMHDVSPPSFAASEAAQARRRRGHGRYASVRVRQQCCGARRGIIPNVAGLTVPLGGGIALAPRGSVHHTAACTPAQPPPPLTDEPPPPIADLTPPPPSLPEHEGRGAPPGYEGHAGPAGDLQPIARPCMYLFWFDGQHACSQSVCSVRHASTRVGRSSTSSAEKRLSHPRLVYHPVPCPNSRNSRLTACPLGH